MLSKFWFRTFIALIFSMCNTAVVAWAKDDAGELSPAAEPLAEGNKQPKMVLPSQLKKPQKRGQSLKVRQNQTGISKKGNLRDRRKVKGKRQAWPKATRKKTKQQMPQLGPAPFETGERLYYQIKMLNTVAGEGIIAVGPTKKMGKRDVRTVAGFIRSSPLFSKFYSVDDQMTAILDERTFLPLKVDFKVHEKKNRLNYVTVYDHRQKVLQSRKTKDGKVLDRNYSPEGKLFEPLGAVFGLRRMALTVGDEFVAYLWDGRKERQIEVKVAGEERVWTHGGWFETLRIDIETTIVGGFITKKMLETPPKKGRIWIATDKYRTPVKMLSPTKLGLAEVLFVRRFHETGKQQANLDSAFH